MSTFSNHRGCLHRSFAASDFLPILAALFGCLFAAGLHADTYTYTAPAGSNATGTPDNWSAGAGAGWDATPVSAATTTLVITGPTANNVTRFTANDVANPFLLNVLTLAGSGPAGASATATMTVQGSALNFVTDGAGQPVVNLNATRGSGALAYIFVVNNALSLSATTTFQGNGTATANFAGAITGAGGITKTGTSFLQISNASNAYGGATNVSGGTLSLGVNNVLPNGSAVTVSSTGLLDFNSRSDTLASLSLTGTGTMNNTSGAIVISGTLTNASTSVAGSGAALVVNSGGRLTVNGLASFAAGSQTLMGGGNGTRLTLNGGLSLTGATIRMNTGADSRIVLGGNITINDPGTATGSALGSNAATLASGLDLNGGSRTITVADSAAAIDFLVAPVVLSSTGTGAVVKDGLGTMALANTNTYNGGTTVSAGALLLQANGAAGTGNVTVATGATIDLSSAAVTTGAIADTGALALSSSGGIFAMVAFGANTLNETVAALQINGVPMAAGTYNSANLPDYITGSGSVTVVPEPGCASLLLLGVGLLGMRRRARR